MPSLAAAENVAGCGTTRIVGATAWIRGGTHVRERSGGQQCRQERSRSHASWLRWPRALDRGW